MQALVEMQRCGSSLFPSMEASLKLLVSVGIHLNRAVESIGIFKKSTIILTILTWSQLYCFFTQECVSY